MADTLAELRAEGWSVAVHNDYRAAGQPHTFWLLTHPDGRWIKGEAATDRGALIECRIQADRLRSQGERAAAIEEAARNVANFAWSSIKEIDCTEAAGHLNRLLTELRAALSSPPPSERGGKP